MIGYSDNTAAAALVDRVGIANVNRTLQNIGLTDSRLDFVNDNITTANDVAELLERIALGRAVSPAASRQMLDLLLGQQINNLIPKGLPLGTPMAHKTGTLIGLRHDAGIVYGASGPYIFVMMSSNLPDDNTPYDIVPRLSWDVYTYFNNRPSQPARYFRPPASLSPRLSCAYGTLTTARRRWAHPRAGAGEQRLPDPVVQEGPPGAAATGATTPDQVEVGSLGLEVLAGRHFDPVPDPGDPARLWFQATGQVLADPFLSYWQTHGGVRLFGNPISPALTEDEPGGGSLRVQYFEHARLELHGDQVQVSALGRLLASQQ